MEKRNNILHITLWIAQAVLAAMFIMAGLMKIVQPIEALAEMLPWVESVPSALVRFIGLSELLGGLGLVLPAVLRIKPNLTSLAALGLALVMLAALIFHITRSEFDALVMNIILGGVALFIAWGRSKKEPIQSK